MKSSKIIVIDSGIANYSKAYSQVIESYSVAQINGKVVITPCESRDYIGHGSAVGQIICDQDSQASIISFRICHGEADINEDVLLATLQYIWQSVDADIINISAGVTFSYKCRELHDICVKLHEKGMLMIAAFDNGGAISYPAMFDEVIGVDIVRSYNNRDEIIVSQNGIVNVSVPERYYRARYAGKMEILKGTSFACAYITGLISKKRRSLGTELTKTEVLNYIKTSEVVFPNNQRNYPWFKIKKAIIFPLVKETHALLRFDDLLPFQIVGVYDERLAGRVGETFFGYEVQSYDSINWDDDFDTVILSCTQQLSKLTHRPYSEEIVKMAHKHNKNIYSFEKVDNCSDKYYYPEVTTSSIPHRNNNKLHQCVIPVVGVWGTSSKQGKYTLQLEMIRRLKRIGYYTGHIATEPSGYLFDSDFVFHCGYNADLPIEPWECTTLLNQEMWEIQNRGKDIVITGGQSGVIPYSNLFVEPFFEYQYAYLMGVRPDFNILCINPHDDSGYVKKTCDFISSMTEEGVCAIVLFPVQAIETVTGVGYSTKKLSTDEQKYLKERYTKKYGIPVYLLDFEEELDLLCNSVIDFFSEE